MGCIVPSQTPGDGTVYSPGTSFSSTLVLQNSDDTKWDKNEYNIVYVGDAANIPLHQSSDGYDLTSTAEPCWTYSFIVPMIAPFDSGTIGELWHVVPGNQPVCEFYVYIEVRESLTYSDLV